MLLKLDAEVLDLKNPIDAKGGGGWFIYEGKVDGWHVLKSKNGASELKVAESAEIDEEMKKINPSADVWLEYAME